MLLIHVDKAFMHCAKALMRGRVWDPDARVPRDSFPSMGEILRAHAGGDGPVESQEEMIRRYRASAVTGLSCDGLTAGWFSAWWPR